MGDDGRWCGLDRTDRAYATYGADAGMRRLECETVRDDAEWLGDPNEDKRQTYLGFSEDVV